MVMDAKELLIATKEGREKGSRCAQDSCIIDVPLPGVSHINISRDGSVVAVCTDRGIHFFKLRSLLNKDIQPLSTCCFGQPASLKDFKWLNEGRYIVLSTGGLLSHGKIDKPLEDAYSSVDAADCSQKGNCIAIVRGKKLSIISSDFKERMCMPLSLLSSDEFDCKVDCVSWLRNNSIAIGCLRLSKKGLEEEYIVQIISNETNTPLEATVYTYSDLFNGFKDNIRAVPDPQFCYLSRWDMLFASSKKSIRGQIACLKRTQNFEEKYGTEMLESKYTTIIDLQGKCHNAVLGFAVGHVSLDQKTGNFGLCQEEVAPQHFLIFLTDDGKLSIYCFSRISDHSDLPPSTVSRQRLSPTVTSVLCNTPSSLHSKPGVSFKLRTTKIKALSANKKLPASALSQMSSFIPSVKEELPQLCDGTEVNSLCFDEEGILHDFLVCPADMSQGIVRLPAYLDWRLVVWELTPGSLIHETIYTADKTKEIVREVYVLLKCLHKKGYSLAGNFTMQNFAVYESRLRLTVKFAGLPKRLFLKKPGGQLEDLERFVRMVKTEMFKGKCIPHDLNLWLSDIFEEGIEVLLPYHANLMGIEECGDTLMVWYDRFLDLKAEDRKAYDSVCINMSSYDGWQEVLKKPGANGANTYLLNPLMRQSYKKKFKDLLRLLRNIRQHDARHCHEKFALIVGQHFPNLFRDFQRQLFLAGCFRGKYRAV